LGGWQAQADQRGAAQLDAALSEDVLHPSSCCGCLPAAFWVAYLVHEGVEELLAQAHVETRHRDCEKPATHAGEHGAAEGHAQHLQGGVPEAAGVWVDAGEVNNLASVVGNQGLEARQGRKTERQDWQGGLGG
jgi:hypothetical protein